MPRYARVAVADTLNTQYAPPSPALLILSSTRKVQQGRSLFSSRSPCCLVFGLRLGNTNARPPELSTRLYTMADCTLEDHTKAYTVRGLQNMGVQTVPTWSMSLVDHETLSIHSLFHPQSKQTSIQ